MKLFGDLPNAVAAEDMPNSLRLIGAALGFAIAIGVPHCWFRLLLLAGIERLLSSSMIEVLHSEFVKLARMRHCLRNTLTPVLSLAGVYITLLISETVVIEEVFA